MEVLFCEPHLHEALPSEDICRAAIVNKDPSYIVSSEVYRVSANVCMDDKGVVMRVVLKPKVSFGKCDWDMGPRGTEVFAFAHIRNCAEVFFPLTLHLVHRLV